MHYPDNFSNRSSSPAASRPGILLHLEDGDLLFLDALAQVQGAGGGREEMVRLAVRYFRGACEARAGGPLGRAAAGALGAPGEELK